MTDTLTPDQDQYLTELAWRLLPMSDPERLAYWAQFEEAMTATIKAERPDATQPEIAANLLAIAQHVAKRLSGLDDAGALNVEGNA